MGNAVAREKRWLAYEAFKAYLRECNLSAEEYDKLLRKWCDENGY